MIVKGKKFPWDLVFETENVFYLYLYAGFKKSWKNTTRPLGGEKQE